MTSETMTGEATTRRNRLHDEAAISTLIHDGITIRYAFWQAANTGKPLFVLLPGFTEFIEKYASPASRLHEEGYDIVVLDWPSQGLSSRFLADRIPVHANNFNLHLDCLKAVLDAVAEKSRPLILFGHSMGGHLALRLAAESQRPILGAILTAPMMLPPFTPPRLIHALLGMVTLSGFAKTPVPWRHERPRDSVFYPENALTRDPEGFAFQPELWRQFPDAKTFGPTFGWVRAAYRSCIATTANPHWLKKLSLPVLAHIPGDERIVHAEYQRRSLERLPDCRIIDYPEARHELLLETPDVRKKFWRESLAFAEMLSSASSG